MVSPIFYAHSNLSRLIDTTLDYRNKVYTGTHTQQESIKPPSSILA